MKYVSVCSGIEAATVAWHPLGWEPVGFSEIEPFPSAVLAHHYPGVPNLGDMTKFKEWNLGTVDLLVGGTPCQSFSVAGLRKGLDDPRGNLMLTYLAIADKYRPSWLVWENVPGVLSSNGGRDFGTLLGGLGELGYGFAYRVLDAQYFGVAQRRRRVFVVGCLGNWRAAAAVLFEPESLRGDTAPSREARKEVTECAGTLTANGGGLNRPAGNANELDFCVTVDRKWPADISSTLDTTFGTKQGLQDQHVNAGCPMFVPAYGIPGNWIGRKPENGGNSTQFMEEVAPCLTGADKHGVAQPIGIFQDSEFGVQQYNTAGTLRAGRIPEHQMALQPIGLDEEQNAMIDAFGTLKARTAGGGFEGSVMQSNMAVRRLTPIECERLQGFPDGYTNIPWRKATESPDSPRYKALGNSMAVPVMAWIGRRIQTFADLQ
jgi:DNA (cytosine-5)-methyltransferase 1